MAVEMRTLFVPLIVDFSCSVPAATVKKTSPVPVSPTGNEKSSEFVPAKLLMLLLSTFAEIDSLMPLVPPMTLLSRVNSRGRARGWGLPMIGVEWPPNTTVLPPFSLLVGLPPFQLALLDQSPFAGPIHVCVAGSAGRQ